MKLRRLFEAHIAAQDSELICTEEVRSILIGVGFHKVKYFLGVTNFDQLDHPAGVPPTGHDLDCPTLMATSKSQDWEGMKELIREGMRQLRDLGVECNFEVEEVIVNPSWGWSEINFDLEFPEFERVPDSPAQETHIIWKNYPDRLPSHEAITKVMVSIGSPQHQIVDFGSIQPNDSMLAYSQVSRVATIYQPTTEECFAFASKTEQLSKLLPYRYMVSEKVHYVGQWPKHCL